VHSLAFRGGKFLKTLPRFSVSDSSLFKQPSQGFFQKSWTFGGLQIEQITYNQAMKTMPSMDCQIQRMIACSLG
jgi:hypothetical protein